MREKGFYWVRLKNRENAYEPHQDWMPAWWDARDHDPKWHVIGDDSPIYRNENFSFIGPKVVMETLCFVEPTDRPPLAPVEDLRSVTVKEGNWLGLFCKLLNHRWHNVAWNEAATVWRVRCSVCGRIEDRNWRKSDTVL